MKLSSVLEQVSPVRGVSSVIAALLGGGDTRSVSARAADLAVTREQAEAELARNKKWLAECQSDYAYWGYLGAVDYWQLVINLLKAAELVGADDLPDVAIPPRDGIVMDLIAKQERFGKEVLRLAQERAGTTTTVPNANV